MATFMFPVGDGPIAGWQATWHARFQGDQIMVEKVVQEFTPEFIEQVNNGRD